VRTVAGGGGGAVGGGGGCGQYADPGGYAPTTFPVHDAGKPTDGQPVFLYPNTTTLVEIILNRQQSDKVLNIVKRG